MRWLEPGENDAEQRHRFYSDKPYNAPYIAVAAAALFPSHFGALGVAGVAKTKYACEMSCLQCVGLASLRVLALLGRLCICGVC
jgi:hypothetical protein